MHCHYDAMGGAIASAFVTAIGRIGGGANTTAHDPESDTTPHLREGGDSSPRAAWPSAARKRSAQAPAVLHWRRSDNRWSHGAMVARMLALEAAADATSARMHNAELRPRETRHRVPHSCR
jgi:hypothetical protein